MYKSLSFMASIATAAIIDTSVYDPQVNMAELA